MTGDSTWIGRRREAAQLRAGGESIAREVTDTFLQRHPDWVARYGDRARIHGEQDARFHTDFLAGTIESGSPEAFADYAVWTASMLQARGIDPSFLLENLRQVGAAASNVLSDESSVAIVQAAVDAAVAAVTRGGESGAIELDALHPVTETFLQAIINGNRHAALGIARESLADGASMLDVYADIIQTSLHRIGDLWARNEISVADEHLATAIGEYVVSSLYGEVVPAPATRGRALVTGVTGERHQVGSHIVADALEADGWNVRFLGTDAPHAHVVATVREFAPHVVGVSTTILANLSSAATLIDEIVQQVVEEEAAPRVLVGGRAFEHAQQMAIDAGAHAYAPGVREAVQVARQWSIPTSAPS